VAETKQIRQDRMTPIERMNALLAGQPIDRVPVWLWLFSSGFAALNVGYSLADSYNDSEKSFWAQLWTIEMYGSDDFPKPICAGNCDAAWVFGGQFKWPTSRYEQAPSVIRYPVESEEDAQKLELPRDVKTAGSVPLYMQFAKLQERHGLPISLPGFSPIEFVRGTCGLETLCRWLVRKPELVHRLLRLATDYSVEVVRYWADTFVPQRILVQTWLPSASNQVISPNHFKTFVLPYQKEFHEKILATGIKHIVCHICGEQNLNLPYWAHIPMGNPGIVSFGQEVDLTTAIKYFGDTCIIAGNVEPAVIQAGTHEQVYELCRQAIEKAKYAPRGFMLMPGCALPPAAPPYNVFMLRKAVNDFGWYD